MLDRDEAYENYLMVKEAGIMQTLKDVPSKIGKMFRRAPAGKAPVSRQELRILNRAQRMPGGSGLGARPTRSAASLGAAAPASSSGRKGLSLSEVAKQSQNRQAMINKYRGGGQADSQLIGIKDGGKITRVFK